MTIRYHEMTYFRELVDAGNLKQEDGRKAAINKFIAALKAQRSRTDNSSLQKAVDKYAEELDELISLDTFGVLSRGRLTLACEDREIGIRIDRKPFHHVKDPAVVSSFETGCAEYALAMQKYYASYDGASIAIRTKESAAQIEAAEKGMRQAMKDLSELDLRLAASARDYDIQASWKLQAQLLIDAAAEGTAQKLVNAEALLGEEFDVTDQVLQRYCGTKGR